MKYYRYDFELVTKPGDRQKVTGFSTKQDLKINPIYGQQLMTMMDYVVMGDRLVKNRSHGSLTELMQFLLEEVKFVTVPPPNEISKPSVKPTEVSTLSDKILGNMKKSVDTKPEDLYSVSVIDDDDEIPF